jgi:Zn-dependent M16 (insulinase) family peptidase
LVFKRGVEEVKKQQIQQIKNIGQLSNMLSQMSDEISQDNLKSWEDRQAANDKLVDDFTHGIVYLDLCFPAGCLDERQQLLLPLFGRAVCGCGLPGMSYSEVSLELFRLTGGFFAQLDAGGMVGRPEEQARHAFFRTRCLRQNLGEAVNLVGRLLAGADFRDLPRLRDIILEHRNGMKSALIPSGHHYAQLRAGSMLSASVAQEDDRKSVV